MSEHKSVLSGALKQDFQKDLELFKYFLLLLNNSSPIRNVELMWVDEIDSQKSVFKERVNTQDALVQLQPADPGQSNRSSPSTLFCDLVHGFGANEEGTCAKSDVPAMQRCRATECTQVYPCHIGLTDIAVPVISDGNYLGTLFSGQVLLHPPHAEHFEQVKGELADKQHIDFARLESAYYDVPVVTQAHLSEMVRALELFARYIANSWSRLQIMGELQRVQSRELTLNRKELAAILLSGHIGDPQYLDSLAKQVGLSRLPNSVLLLRMRHEASAGPQMSHHITLSRLSQVVEDLCQSWPNTLCISPKAGELCIFTSADSRNLNHHRISLQERSEAVLAALRRQSCLGARVGIGTLAEDPQDLLRLYHEASSALNSQMDAISFFEENRAASLRPTQSLAVITKAIRQGENVDSAVRSFLARAMPTGSGADHLNQTRALLTWAVEHLALEVVSLGVEARTLAASKDAAVREILGNATPFGCCEAVRSFAEFLGQQIATSFAHREKKIVLAVDRLVERRGAAGVTIQILADALHLSPGHLSRVYSRTTGMTLEAHLIGQRIEMAKRMLLDPRLNVAEVSDRCGFCNPAYFASVFKKYVHCPPRQFASRPTIWKPLEDAEGAAENLPHAPYLVSDAASDNRQEITIT